MPHANETGSTGHSASILGIAKGHSSNLGKLAGPSELSLTSEQRARRRNRSNTVSQDLEHAVLLPGSNGEDIDFLDSMPGRDSRLEAVMMASQDRSFMHSISLTCRQLQQGRGGGGGAGMMAPVVPRAARDDVGGVHGWGAGGGDQDSIDVNHAKRVVTAI